jgi:hypothetical protein
LAALNADCRASQTLPVVTPMANEEEAASGFAASEPTICRLF